MWSESLDRWVLQSAIFGTVVLFLGAVALMFAKQPVYRIRIIQCTLWACLCVPILQHCDLLPGYSLELWRELNKPTEMANSANAVPTLNGSSPMSIGADNASVVSDPTKAANSFPNKSLPFSNGDGHGQSASVAYDPGSVGRNASETISQSSWLIFTVRLVYLIGLGLSVSGLIVGWFARRRIVRGSQSADDYIRDTLRSIAGPKADRIRLLVSEHVSAPIMWGILRPTIVVPTRLVDHRIASHLKYGLAHEWSHVHRRDFSNFVLANLTKFVCFYQPIFWWLRKQLTLSQDFLADAFAAHQGDQAEDYAAFLVTLARRQRSIDTIGVLCMADRKSALLRRVCMLVNRSMPLQQQLGRWSALAMASVTVLAIASLSMIRLSAQIADGDDQKQPIEKVAPVPPAKALPDAITYTGKVIDRDTGEPIVGASVEISRQLSHDPKTNRWIDLEVTKHETDATGTYRFTLPPEQVAESSLYIEVTTSHPNYQPKGPEGYSHSMILKNMDIGEPPFYETIKLVRGEPVTFRVLHPNGKPVDDTQITAYSKAPSASRLAYEYGAFQNSKTDANGEGRVVVATPGDGVIWVFPKEFSPVAIRIGDKRGKISDVVLHGGATLSGTVLNTRGEPVPNVAFNVRRKGDGEETDEFLNNNSVSNYISSGARTDDSGHFVLRPLPPGTYWGEVASHVEDPAIERVRRLEELTVKDVFMPMEITIAEGAQNAPIEVRAVPHVIVRGRFFDSKGKPRRSHEQHLFATSNGNGYIAQSTIPGEDGWFEFKVPHGVEKAEVNLMTNEHSSLRWRLKPDQPLQHSARIELGTLEEDVTSLEIVRYTAPILLVKAVDEKGVVLSEFKPNSQYKVKSEKEMMSFTNGGHVGFEKQPDNRWRSSQMQPDEELEVSITMEGYESSPQTVSIPEGETRELKFVMKKKD